MKSEFYCYSVNRLNASKSYSKRNLTQTNAQTHQENDNNKKGQKYLFVQIKLKCMCIAMQTGYANTILFECFIFFWSAPFTLSFVALFHLNYGNRFVQILSKKESFSGETDTAIEKTTH